MQPLSCLSLGVGAGAAISCEVGIGVNHNHLAFLVIKLIRLPPGLVTGITGRKFGALRELHPAPNRARLAPGL